jgi:NAD(P)-dependent dehydrogenase (short-subunit alcohol dehydrogenase family)
MRECKQLSGRDALAVPTNVTDEAAVQSLARAAFEHFGRIDVWINNAGVGAYGRFEDIPADVFRQVIETNFFGTIYGARAVLPYFRRQGHGTLINNASMMAAVSGPYYSAYAASKFAVRALSETLRQEINVLDRADIHICTIMPATIDTPFFRHAANYSGRDVKAMPPVYPPELVAKLMVSLVGYPRRETFVGSSARMIGFTHYYAPSLAEPVVAKQIDMTHFKSEAAPDTPGAVLEPMEAGTEASDGWGGAKKMAIRLIIGGSVGAGAALAASALVAWTWFRSRL